jgi:hypothetical protein
MKNIKNYTGMDITTLATLFPLDDSGKFAGNIFKKMINFKLKFLDDEIKKIQKNEKIAKKQRKPSMDRKDGKIYGLRPADDLVLVTCHHCGMVLKKEALYDHFQRRHENNLNANKRRKLEGSIAFVPVFTGDDIEFSVRNGRAEPESKEVGKIRLKLKRVSGSWTIV